MGIASTEKQSVNPALASPVVVTVPVVPAGQDVSLRGEAVDFNLTVKESEVLGLQNRWERSEAEKGYSDDSTTHSDS